MPMRHKLAASDILAWEDYAQRRPEHRRRHAERKRDRRVEVGPYVTFYFENADTMWFQVQEMMHIEKGGAEQLKDELAAYNPLIPQGAELVATFMIEIDDPLRRARVLGSLGGIEETAFFRRRSGASPRPTRTAPARKERRAPCSSCTSLSRRRRSRRSDSPMRR